jgi:hypothetical protein
VLLGASTPVVVAVVEGAVVVVVGNGVFVGTSPVVGLPEVVVALVFGDAVIEGAKLNMPPSDATVQYPVDDEPVAIPTIGWVRCSAPVEPRKRASPKLKIPPSRATSQYPWPEGVAAMPTIGWVRCSAPVDPRNRAGTGVVEIVVKPLVPMGPLVLPPCVPAEPLASTGHAPVATMTAPASGAAIRNTFDLRSERPPLRRDPLSPLLMWEISAEFNANLRNLRDLHCR